MPLHPQAQALLEAIESLGDRPLEESTPGAVRALRASRLRPPTVSLAEIRDVDAGGIPTRLYRPSVEPGLGLLVYLHGGGWVLGNLDTHDNVVGWLADESGHADSRDRLPARPRAFVPRRTGGRLHGGSVGVRQRRGDRLRPRAARDRRRLGRGRTSRRSATQAGTMPFRFQLLVYPVTDARGGSPSDEAQGRAVADGGGNDWFIGHYLSGAETGRSTIPAMSPLLAGDEALANSPPTVVDHRRARPAARRGRGRPQRLRSLGVPVDVTRYEGMFHGFCPFADLLDDGRRAVSQAAAALAGALGSTAQGIQRTATSGRRSPVPTRRGRPRSRRGGRRAA